MKIRHTAGAKERLEQAHKVMGISNTLSVELESIFNQWAKVRMTDSEVRRLIELALAPNKEVLSNIKAGRETEWSKQFAAVCEDVFAYSQTSPTQQTQTTKGTLFGAYNAVTGYYQNIRSYKSEESKLKSLFYGGLAQERTARAFALCNRFQTTGAIDNFLN